MPGTHRIEVEGAFQTGTDELGVYAWIRVDPSVFSQIAVLKTAYWFSERFYLYLARTTDGALLVELRHKISPSTSNELTSACREFCNSVIDHEVRQQVLYETSAVRDSLIRKAFFDVQSPDAALKAQGNEAHVPQNHQSYRDDPRGIGLLPHP